MGSINSNRPTLNQSLTSNFSHRPLPVVPLFTDRTAGCDFHSGCGVNPLCIQEQSFVNCLGPGGRGGVLSKHKPIVAYNHNWTRPEVNTARDSLQPGTPNNMCCSAQGNLHFFCSGNRNGTKHQVLAHRGSCKHHAIVCLHFSKSAKLSRTSIAII